MMPFRSFRFYLLLGVVVGLISTDVYSQNQRRPGNRQRLKPGEVIAPPERSNWWQDNIKEGDKAPDFELPLVDETLSAQENEAKAGSKKIKLSELYKKQPVVLVFGSYTCPPFRRQLERVEELYKKHKTEANFLFVYTREAHPDSILSVVDKDGTEKLQKFIQPKDADTRMASASFCQRTVKLTMPMVVDDVDNKVGKAYAGRPNRMLIIGTDGKIAYASRPAPNGTDSRRLEEWLQELQKD